MANSEFQIPDPHLIAIAALKRLRDQGTHVVFHGQALSVACCEREALAIATPDEGDVYFRIDDLVAELSEIV